MKAFLLHRDRDFDLEAASPLNESDLVADLELEVVLAAAAGKDRLVYDVVRKALLTGVGADPGAILYRQQALRDALADPATVRGLYALANEAFERQRKVWGHFREYPSGRLTYAVETMTIYVDVLKRLRALADRAATDFKSEAFGALFGLLRRELTDAYFAVVDAHLKRLKFRGGVLVSVGLGQGLRGEGYTLRRPRPPEGGWLRRLLAERPPVYKLHLAPRDEAGARAMGELRDRGLALAAAALGRSADHVLGFFRMLQIELAFYIGCLALHERLRALDAPIAFPSPAASSPPHWSGQDLYDVSLALSAGRRPVGNEFAADGKALIVVTGANQGGKTTFLRSLGIAQLMMQAGMFVPAAQFGASVVDAVFTHFRREEDASMKSGKFDEEMARMSAIVDRIAPHSLLLFNESFAATNEREGSEIARQIVAALLERPHKAAFVTHHYALAHGLFQSRRDSTLFLRAERGEDGRRAFKLVEGEPLGTSFGVDVYREVFRDAPEAAAAAAPASALEARVAANWDEAH